MISRINSSAVMGLYRDCQFLDGRGNPSFPEIIPTFDKLTDKLYHASIESAQASRGNMR